MPRDATAIGATPAVAEAAGASRMLHQLLRGGRSFSGNERNCCFLNTGGQRFAVEQDQVVEPDQLATAGQQEILSGPGEQIPDHIMHRLHLARLVTVDQFDKLTGLQVLP